MAYTPRGGRGGGDRGGARGGFGGGRGGDRGGRGGFSRGGGRGQFLLLLPGAMSFQAIEEGFALFLFAL